MNMAALLLVLLLVPASCALNPLIVVEPAAAAAAAPSIVVEPATAAAAAPSIVVEPATAAAAAPSIVVEPAAAAAASSSSSSKQEREKQELQEIAKMKQEANGMVSFTNGTGSYKGMSREFIIGHNNVRHRYGVPPMKWNKKLARHARRWSNAMRKDCQLKHSSGNNYGESIFVSPKSSAWNATAKDALWTWSSEESIYDRLTGNCTGGRHFNDCGHFSLMVAQKNQKLGCGRAECYRGGVFITCNYYLRDHDP